MRIVICFASERRSEWINVTREKLCDLRASPEAIEPVVGTMLVVSTKTGRPPSPARLNRAFGAKLRSISPCWSRFNEYEPATLKLNRLRNTHPFQLRSALRRRDAW